MTRAVTTAASAGVDATLAAATVLGVSAAALTAAPAELTAAATEMEIPSATAMIFDDGGIVPSAAGGMVMGSSGGLAILHPREMVLPANISSGLQNMISRPTARDFSQNSPAAVAAAGNRDQSTGHQFTQHAHHNIQAMDRAGVD